jgi:GH25 family lysozyme M1 (1,4-beta-N-acetylmuramidase)
MASASGSAADEAKTADTTEKDQQATSATTPTTDAVDSTTSDTATTTTTPDATTSDTATTTTTPDATTSDTATTPDATTSDTATTPTTPDATTPDEATTPDADVTTPDTATTPDATTPDGTTTPDADGTTPDTATTPDATTDDEPATAAATTQAATTQAATTTVTTQAYRDQWVQEGSRWYYYDASGSRASGWVVNSTFKTYGLQRYWLDTTTKALASSELVKASEAGYWAYATRYGYVVRGRYTEGGVTYLADNDGRLESPGWHVSSAYGQGLQRYYVDSTKHGCTDGYSTAGWAHYTTPAGYVLRGHLTSGTVTYLADNDGRLATSEGWLVSSSYGQGLQRYYVTAAKHGCVTGYSTAGWAHYTTPAGYVLRGHLTSGTVTYLADNDGRLATSEGWLVSSAYGQGLQRYYVTAAKHGCVTGYSTAGWAHYTTPAGYVLRGAATCADGARRIADNDGRVQASGWLVTSAFGQGLQRYWLSGGSVAASRLVSPSEGAGYWAYATSAGYVLRGHLTSGTVTYLADNDGRLATSEGWLVSSAYGQGLQRYYVTAAKHGCVTGYSAAGWAHYTTSAGYVLRGHLTSGTVTYLADNDGRLATSEGWLVSSAYGQGLQRYYVTAAKHGCVTGYSTAGWAHYTTSEGYALRNAYIHTDGVLYRADNDAYLLAVSQCMDGIDIASYQSSMNTSGVSADFIIVKATQGTGYNNPYASSQLSGAVSAGKGVGLYHYAEGGDAVSEADHFVARARSLGVLGSAVLALDWEGGDNATFGSGSDVSWCSTFLNRVYQTTGVRALLYVSKAVTSEYNWSSVSSSYGLWVAQYADMDSHSGYQSDPWTDGNGYGSWSSPTIFQYSSTTYVSGYGSQVDVDKFYGDLSYWKYLAGAR